MKTRCQQCSYFRKVCFALTEGCLGWCPKGAVKVACEQRLIDTNLFKKLVNLLKQHENPPQGVAWVCLEERV